MNSIERAALEKAKQVEKLYPAYPHWKRGLLWGCVGGFTGLFLALGLIFTAILHSRVAIESTIFFLLFGFVMVGAIGAFRPDKTQTTSNGKQ